ncbi:hypothetical protein C8R44DRAFT_848258, partial [Mycena epipterygia]
MRQPSVTDIRLNNIKAYLTPAVTLLNKLSDAFGTPFIPAISNTTLSLINGVQNVKRNKDKCIQLMENIHEVLYAIVNLHITSDTEGALPPTTLHHIGKFTETLHKIHAFVEAQQNSNKIKHFFHQSEMNTLLKDCQTGLKEALQVLKIRTGVNISNDIAEMQGNTQKMHRELLELISTLSDATTSDRSSSIYQKFTSSQNSSESLSILPARPKIFHGRELELKDIVDKLNQEPARIAILGVGGIGKTSLAKAALHHAHIAAKYENRFFVGADSATTSIELAALIGSHLGLKPKKDLTKPVVQYFSSAPSCLLVLDNLETSWEPLQSRGGIEEFLSLLTDITHLALIMTMRGAERPTKVRWTRPVLKPLMPLSEEAARQTFIDIADDCHDSKDIGQILCLTGNMPLAIDLIAHLVDYEGCFNVLSRWGAEKTSLLSASNDKRMSLDASIAMSLSSPRMTSSPDAKDLLSLLSILPDGLSDVELVQCHLPIRDLLGCKATLLRTSLAYCDDKNQLKSLVPIREHIHHIYPPSSPLFHPLYEYFHLVLDLYQKYHGVHENSTRSSQITSNLGNLHQLLLLELHPDNTNLADVINCTLSLSSFRRLTGCNRTTLLDHIPPFFLQICDHQVQAKYVVEMLSTMNQYPMANPELLIQQGIAHFHHLDDLVLESSFYQAVGYYYHQYKNDISGSAQFFKRALSLANSCGNTTKQSAALNSMAWVKYSISNYAAAQIYAQEAQQIAKRSGNLYHEASGLATEVMCLTALGNLTECIFLSQRARELLQLCGMQGGVVEHGVMTGLAEVYLAKSEYLEARRIHIELARTTSAQQNSYSNAIALLKIAEIDVNIGADVLKVKENLDIAKRKFNTLGFIRGTNQCEMILANLNLREGNTMAAKDLLQQCLNIAQGYDPDGVFYCLETLADVSRWTFNKIDWAVIYLVQAQKMQAKLALYKALRFVGDVFLSEGDIHTAHNLFIVALAGFTFMDVHRSRADCMLRLGDIAKQSGDLVKAAEIWKEASPLFERSLQVKDKAQIDTRVAWVNQNMGYTFGLPKNTAQERIPNWAEKLFL